ncbi:MAG: hypothetical protein WA431_10670 [Candidatus Cybelea sp.]
MARSNGRDLRSAGLRDGARLGTLPIASELYGHGLALDGNTLFVAGRRALWAYRLQQ